MTGLPWANRLSGLSRPAMIALGIAGLFGMIALRGTMVALGGTDSGVTLTAAPAVQAANTVRRGDIVDRNGELMATSVDVYSLYADPRAIWDADEVVGKLATVFDNLDHAALTGRLEDRSRGFVWVRRGLTPRQRQAVFELGLEGLGFRSESLRAYPRGSLAGHVLGHTNIDGLGQMGVELAMEDVLSKGGEAVRLTLDSGVQFALEAELSHAADLHDAIGAAGLVLEVASGEVRALASWPAFNPNRPGAASDDERLNRALGGVYELGSVFKPLTVAAALEADAINLTETFDVRAPIVLRGKEITDTHRSAPFMDASMVLAESSNIGTVRIAQRLGDTGLVEFFAAIGLLERADVDVPGSARPILPDVWTDQAVATASYGHGIAVSPLVFVRAFAGLANGGAMPGLRVMQSEEPVVLTQIMSEATAGEVIDMLRGAVVNGTGRRGDVPGYEVAGKTGTAEKPIAGGYATDRNLNSFAALFPASGPQYVVLIMLDEPQLLEGDGGVTAAWNAAPAAARVIERIAPLLGVAPSLDQAALDRASDNRSAP